MYNLVVMVHYFKSKKLGKYKLITIAMVLACLTANHEAFASDIPVTNVTNSTELKNAINSATAANTIVLSNDIDMSGIGNLSIKSKNINIDGNLHGISSSRNFALLLDTKTNLTIKNVGQVDKDYNIISSFNNNYATGYWGGPITTQNYIGAVTHYDDAKVVIENSVFSNNFSPVDGGVIGIQTIDFDIKDSVFINNSSAQEGGAIWAEVNRGNIENCYFKGNFVRAKGANTSIGGAITQYGYYANRPTYIDNISGTFIENYSYNFGGAITNREANTTAEINKISGDFQSNYAIQTGGAILNAAGTINSIDGTFTNNYLLNTNTSSSAIKNSILLQNNSFGGAIANTQTGGVEAKKDSYIKSISGDFIGNFINTKNGKAYGGAIYNSGIIDEISGTFKDNYVFSEGTDKNLALGGAIYSTKDLTITSGKNGTLFSGNYTLLNNRDRNYNAIYIDSDTATLNLKPKSGKTIQIDDYIDGKAGYNVNIESEYGGTLKLYNDIKNANITTKDVDIDFADSKYHNYEFLSLNSTGTNYLIDFKLDNDRNNIQADTITTKNSSSGIVTLSDIHFIADKTDGGDSYYNGDYVKQILFNNSGGTLQLKLGDNLQQAQHNVISTAINDTINPITNASDKYYKRIYTGDLCSSVELTKTQTLNDSIKLHISSLVWNSEVKKEILGDTFALWLDLETNTDKEFHIAENQQYKINETLNTTSAGKLSVIGQSNISSVLDANNKAVFDLRKESDLTLKNVQIVSAKSDSGSVIKAINQNSSITIDNSSFVDNIAASSGGVISNSSTNNANKINGIFTANKAGSSGGAIFNQGNINSISGEFTSNHTTNSWATGKVVGGAIANKGGTITSINAGFNSNYSDQYGGAIANFVENSVSSEITSVVGNFNNNYIVVNNSEAFGGAVYNNGKISTINGNFIGNHIAQDNLDTVTAHGGAIYNTGTNGLLISGNFLDNYISVNRGSSALGGAIYTKMNTSVVADNRQNTLFKGNYFQIGNNKNNNAIYVDNAYAELTLNATNHGVISLYDNIDGVKGYDVLITGDNTGVVGLYNDIKNADVQAGKVSINLVDGAIKNYTFNSLNTEAETSNIAKWNIDVDLTNGKADTITTTDAGSKGTVLLNNFNIMGSTEQDSLIIQILKNTTNNNNLQLKIADGVLNVVKDVTKISNEVFSSKSYLKQENGISLATKTTTNDSIKFLKDGFYDALQLINQKETSDERKFTFDTAGTHTLLDNLGETKAGVLSINGYSNDSSVSVIDLAGKTGFELAKENTKININNATLTDSTSNNPVIQVMSANNIINLNNAQLKGNIVSNSNPYQLNFSGNNVIVDGKVDNAYATLNDALTTLTFNTNTFENANLSARKGTINLQNSAIDNYNIKTLTSDTNMSYNIDVDAFNKQSDTITAGKTSTGVVKIGSINFLNGITPQDKDFQVQILHSDSNSLTLSLSDTIKSQLFDFGQVTDTVKDTITTVVNYNDKFYESVKDFVIKGNLSVLDDNKSIGKSIGFKDEDMQKVPIAVKEQELLDSLHELSNLNANGKIFNFNTANDVYGAITDIGSVVNDLTINGVADNSKLSVIGLDNNNGFILNEGSTLNISNVNLRGTNSVITNNGGILNFNNKNIVNGKLDGIGTTINNGDLYIGASNIALTLDNKNNLYLNNGTLNSEITGNGTTIIDGDVLTLGKNATISGTLDLNNKAISTVDGSYTTYIINSIKGSGNATIDVDWANAKADTFQATSRGGNIALTLNGSTANVFDTKTIQITSGGVGISLAETSGTKTKTEIGTKNLVANVNWSDKFGGWKRTDTYSEKISAVKSAGANVLDSIQYEVSKTAEGQTVYTDNLDTLALVVQNTVSGKKDKTFSTTDANAVYNVTQNIGTLADNLTISGTKSGENISTINVGNYQGITIADANELTIQNVKVTANGTILNATSSDAQTTIDNAQIVGNIVNAGKVNIKGNSSANNISGTGATVIENSANAQIDSLTQNTLNNKGSLIVNALTITTSASNDGTITNNGTSSVIDLTNNTNATINGNGTLTISGTSTNAGNISQTTLTNNGDFTNNGTLYASDKIVNSGTITTDASNINANNGIENNNLLTLNNGTLASSITGTGDTNITGTVKNNASISQNVNVASTGKLTVVANIGNLTNNGEVFANANNLTGSVNNAGTIALKGTLDKEIAGNGTTTIYGNELTLADGAVIEGTLNVNNAALNITALNTNNMFNNVSFNSGTLNLINGNVNNLSANSFNLTGNVNLLIDADLANSSMDRLPTTTTVTNGSINIKGINLLSDSTNRNTYIPFAYDSFKNNVQTDITEIGKGIENVYQTTTYAPIYKYDVSYNPNDGTFLFARGGGSSSSDFNPSVLPSSVSSQAGAYTAINETFNYAFRHADYSFMSLPKRIRMGMTNRYAIQEPQVLPYKTEYSKEAGFWYQPYTTFENIQLSNGPRVDMQSYGTLVGGDSSYQELKHGWGTVITPYIGYNGSSQHYSGISTYTNGGILGITQSFYKNNFFTAVTVNAGANVGESNTMYGSENFTTLMAGIASKTGYNFEFNNGKFIIQPSYMMSYSFINTFDYTNAAGVNIKSDPLHTIQIHPTIKFIGNLKNGWQPYASVGMVWNLLNDTKVTANNVSLPQMSIKPYVEYGVGVQKSYQDKFTGFVQAMIRNGGRNGIALSFGFKWAIGKDKKHIERVQTPVKNRKVVIKQINRV